MVSKKPGFQYTHPHWYERRLLLTETESPFVSEGGKKEDIRCYNKAIGWLLYQLKFAVKLTVSGKSLYFNIQSIANNALKHLDPQGKPVNISKSEVVNCIKKYATIDNVPNSIFTVFQKLKELVNQPHPIPPKSATPKVDPKLAAEASLAFVLLNSDFLGVSLSDYEITSKNGLELIMKSLKANRHHLPEEAQGRIDVLLNKFQTAYEIAVFQVTAASESKTTAQYKEAKDSLQKRIIQSLEKGESLYLPSGWAGKPGHNINMELIPSLSSDGTMMVKGRIQNRGSGLKHHKAFIKGTKITYDSAVELKEISLKDLKSSPFLDYFLELNFSVRPRDDGFPKYGIDLSLSTAFTAEDFYHVFLPSWPGGLQYRTEPTPTTEQRSGTCTVKPLMTEILEVLGNKYGKMMKYYMTKQSWETYIKQVGVNEKNVEQIEPILSKLSRRALKLREAGLLPEVEIAKLNTFSEQVKRSIRTVRAEKCARIRKEKSLVNTVKKETTSYALSLPTIAPMPVQGAKAYDPASISLEGIKDAQINAFIEKYFKLAQEAQKQNSLKKAQKIVLHCLRALPNPADAAWETLPDHFQTLERLEKMQQILLEASVSSDNNLTITPQQACIWVKTLGIVFAISKRVLPSNLCQFYANGFKNMIEVRLSTLFAPLHPQDLSVFRDTVQFIYKYTSEDYKKNAVRGESLILDQVMSGVTVQKAKFNSLVDMLENPELNYLYNRVRKEDIDEENTITLMRIAYQGRRFDSDLCLDKTEYHHLRHSFYLSNLAIDLHLKTRSSKEPVQINFNTKSYRKDEGKGLADFSVNINNTEGLISSGNDVYSDVFPGINFEDEYASFRPLALGETPAADHTSFFGHINSALQAFYRRYLPKSYFNEEALSVLDAQDLMVARLPDALPLVQLEYFFSKNLKQLENPCFQSLFQLMLFKPDRASLRSTIADAIERSPVSHEIDNFFSFLNQSLVKTRETRSWNAYFFLLRTYAVAISHCLHNGVAPENRELILKQREQILTDFKTELDLISSPVWKRKIYGEGIATFQNSLLGMIPYLSPYEEAKKVVSKIQKIAQGLIVQDRDPIHNFHLEDDKAQGIFQSENANQQHLGAGSITTLPQRIVESDLYSKLFNENYSATIIFPGYYRFFDENGNKYHLHENEQGVVRIFRAFTEENGEEAWYAFQLDDPFKGYGDDKKHPCSLSSGHFHFDTTTWFKVGEEKQAIVIDKEKGGVLCRVFPDKIVHPTQPNQVLVKDYNEHTIIDRLSKITYKQYLLAWKEGETPTTIQLILDKLNFNRETDAAGNVRWKSSMHQGYYIDEHSKCSAFEPFPNYLVLMNSAGQRKVIIPSTSYEPEKIKFPNDRIPKKDSDIVWKLFAYDVDEKGAIILPEDPESLLYLTYLAIKKQDHVLGFQALKKIMQHPAEWDKTMILMLNYFEIRGSDIDALDRHPLSVALRLKIKSTFLDQSSEQMSKGKKSSLKRDYIDYLNQIGNIQGDWALSVEEEQRLYSVLQAQEFSDYERVVMQNRKKHLETLSVVFPEDLTFALEKEQKKAAVKYSNSFDWVDDPMREKIRAHQQQPVAIEFPMRPGVSFLHNLLYYYTILKQNAPENEVKAVREQIIACRYDPDDRIQSVRGLLLSMLSVLSKPDNPVVYPAHSDYPEPDDLLYKSLTRLVKKKGEIEELISFDAVIQGGSDRLGTSIPPSPMLSSPRPKKMEHVNIAFKDIPDTLLNDLHVHQIVLTRMSTDKDKAAFKARLESLGELKEFYTAEIDKNKDPAIKKEFERLLEGVQKVMKGVIEERDRLDNVPVISFDPKKIPEAIQLLTTKKESESTSLVKKKVAIEKILDTYPSEIILEKHGELLQPLSFEEALLHFGRDDYVPFYRANPEITPDKLRELKGLIADYLLHQLNGQKTVRLLDNLQKADKVGKTKGIDSVEYTVTLDVAVETLQSNRIYVPSENPHLLLFEAFADFCMREEQLTALNELTKSIPDKQEHIIYEARTGFGKSKALIPLWLYLTGKERKTQEKPGLAMMTVPSSLYQQQVAYLKKILGGAFNQSVVAFEFNRENGGDLAYLKNLNRRLDKAAANGMCVLTTVNSSHSFVNLKIKEMLCLEPTKHNLAILHELKELRNKIKNRLSNFFDESRECFDIRRHYDYAVGSAKAVSDTYCTALNQVYTTLISLTAASSFDFTTESDGKKPPPVITEEKYLKEIKPKMAERLLESFLATVGIPIPDENQKKLLLEHLMGGYDSALDSYLESIPEDKIGLYAIYRGQLNTYLPRTLTRQCNGRYGLAQKKTGNRFAYPFERGVPNLGSQFSTIDDLLDFTIQANLKTPFTYENIREFLNDLKFRMAAAEDPEIFKQSDPSYRCYLAVTQGIVGWPASLIECEPDHVKKLHDRLNDRKNIHHKLTFITQQILPKIHLHEKKICSSSHNLVEAIHQIYGASGTINKDTLSAKLKTTEYSETPIKSILAMWQDSQNAIYTVPTLEAKSLLQNVITGHPEYRVIIDVASSFRDFRDEKELAMEIFKHTAVAIPPVDAISYYDEAGNNMVFLRPQEGAPLATPILRDICSVPIDNIFVFMRPSATIGADTPMQMTAQALVTVDSTTQRDLFLQGVGRMRGLGRQKVGFVIQENHAQIIKETDDKVSLKSIFSIVSRNQGEQKGLDLFYNLGLVLQNLLEKRFWNFFDDEKNSLEKSIELFNHLKDFFVENAIQDPINTLKQKQGEIDTEEAVKQFTNSFRRKVQPLLAKTSIDIEAIFTEFATLIDYTKLPSKIKMGSANESEGEVEVEAAEVEVENEQENEKDTVSDLPDIDFKSIDPIPTQPYVGFGSDAYPGLTASSSFKEEFASVLNNVYVSTNYFRIEQETEKRPQGILKTAYHYLLVYEGDRCNVVLMDQKDAKATLEQMIEENGNQKFALGKDYYLMSANGKLIAQKASKQIDEERKKQWEDNPRLTLLTKVFTRNFRFNKKEIQYIHGLPADEHKKLMDFFTTEIVPCWPAFGSYLAGQVFNPT